MNNFKLKTFPELRWDLVFKRQIIASECGLKDSFLESVYKMLLTPFVDSIDLFKESNGDSRKILFYQRYHSRRSYREQIYNVHRLVSSDLLSYNENRKKTFHVANGLKLLLFNIPFWAFSMHKGNLKTSQIIEYLPYVIRFYYLLQRLHKKIEINQYNLLVTFCDSELEEAFVSQFFQANRIKTASLQHGAFTDWRENTLINSGVELRTFNSDYLLCWNKFTLDEGVKAGIPNEKMKIVGIIGYVSNSPNDWICPHNKTFGVIIGHPSFEKENIRLIECANIIAKKKGYSYYLKLHPNYDEHYFDNIVLRGCYRGNVKKGVSIQEYASKVDFSIVGSSTVFIELVYINHDVIRYSSGDVTDKFKDIPYGKVVQSIEQVSDVFVKKTSEEENRMLFDYLCGIKDVAAEYERVLNRLAK